MTMEEKIAAYLRTKPSRMASSWEIAQNAFPELWRRRSSHGALIANIDRAASRAPNISTIPPKDRWDCRIHCLDAG